MDNTLITDYIDKILHSSKLNNHHDPLKHLTLLWQQTLFNKD
ncbi:hypothetical protein RCH20_000041 [Psychrobacter sp. PL15]|nr:hypothetical protein [Psychrobacter sp. PL15]